jgi:hypothetical protein
VQIGEPIRVLCIEPLEIPIDLSPPLPGNARAAIDKPEPEQRPSHSSARCRTIRGRASQQQVRAVLSSHQVLTLRREEVVWVETNLRWEAASANRPVVAR